MIFLTLGTMDMPFDRIIKIIDNAVENGLIKEEVFGQIGESIYKPKKFKYIDYLDKEAYNDYFNSSDLIISHAGMGTILQASERKKKLIIIPRLARYGEHVNDHQLMTAQKFNNRSNIFSIIDDNDFLDIYTNAKLAEYEDVNGASKISDSPEEIYSALHTFLRRCNSVDSRIVAGASSGGHLTQLEKILNSSPNKTLKIDIYLTTLNLVKKTLELKGKVHILGECNRKTPLSIIRIFFISAYYCLKDRPNVVISTGALPIAIYCIWAKLMGAKIIWIDSIANIDKISLSGRIIRRFTSLFFTQWPDLADEQKVIKYVGSVL